MLAEGTLSAHFSQAFMGQVIGCLSSFLLIIIVIVVKMFWAKRKTRTAYIRCQSPDCVRCSQNKNILQTASLRAKESAVSSDEAEWFQRDVEQSLEHLNDSEQFTSDKNISCPVVFRMTGLREEALWKPEDIPALELLSDHVNEINEEFEKLYFESSSDVVSEMWKWNSVEGGGRWEIIHLIDQGKTTAAAELCPQTMRALSRIPHVMKDCFFGNASFSVVHPQTIISTHCGSTNCRIRCHLGLQVPPSQCVLQVGDMTCEWKEGELICFDDSFPHSVHHRGTQEEDIRVVFMVDLWHPDITESQKKLLSYAFAS